MARLSIDTGMLIAALEDHTLDVRYFLDRKTGEIIPVPAAGLEEVDPETASAMEEEHERFQQIEPIPSSEGFNVMADFVEALSDSEAKWTLADALRRPRPFRSFRDALQDYPEVREQWFRHHDHTLKSRAEEWLQESGIEAELQPLPHETAPTKAGPSRKSVLPRGGTGARVLDPRYPVGPFRAEKAISAARREQLIQGIAGLPEGLRMALRGLSRTQLDTPYRPGGWTVRQVAHHLADSHMNSYIRMKLAVTEDQPTIKPYDEKRWAELADGRTAPIDLSLDLLDVLHTRWVFWLRSLTPEDFSRTFRHPESGVMSLDVALQYYEWHGRHHTAHITSLRERMGWA